MKKRDWTMIQKYFPLKILGFFIVCVFFYPKLINFSGLFAIAILLVSLKKWNVKRVLWILSPIITYPLFLGVTNAFPGSGDILNLPFHWLRNLTIYIAIYAVLSGFVFKNLWSWLAKNSRKFTIVALGVLAAITLFYGSLMAECHVVSNEEKGVSQVDILKCSQFNLYNPTGVNLSGRFAGLPYAFILIPTQGVGFTAIVVALTLVFFETKDKFKSNK